jgi:hypothetical protein
MATGGVGKQHQQQHHQQQQQHQQQQHSGPMGLQGVQQQQHSGQHSGQHGGQHSGQHGGQHSGQHGGVVAGNATGIVNHGAHGGLSVGHNFNSNKPSMNVWVKIGLRDAVRFRIPENSVVVELKVIMREELCDLFENVNPSTIFVRNHKNEVLSDLSPLKKYMEHESVDLRVGHSAAQPFIVDEPICLVVGPFMEDVEMEFARVCNQLPSSSSSTKLPEFLDLTPNGKVHWYAQLAPHVDYRVILEVQATLRKAKQAALYGTRSLRWFLSPYLYVLLYLGSKYKLKMNDFPLCCLPHHREDPIWQKLHEEPYYLTKYETEVIKDYVWPLLPPNFAAG